MRICMFSNTYLPHVGGVAKSIAAFTEDLRSMGHRVLVIAPTFDDEDKEINHDVLRIPAVQNFNGSDFSVPLPLPFLIDYRLTEFNPHIIHSHHPFLLGDSAFRAARKRSLPLIFTHHTRYEEYTHYVSLGSPTMRQFVINLSTGYANLCSRVIAPSESIAEILAERGLTVPVEVLPTGVDLAFFEQGNGLEFRKRRGLGPEVRIIGHVGRLAPEKNLTFLTLAASSVLKNLKNVYFLVVGDGSSFDTVREICEKEGVSGRLIMTGQLTGPELAGAYRSMDLFVFSSLSETQGMVLVEAMAAQTPVVALDAPGAREVIRNGENGALLSPESSPQDFGRAVLDYLKNEERLNNARKEAVKTAESFSRQACAIKLEGIYKKVLAGPIPESRWGEVEAWNGLLRTFKAEWELLSGKTHAAREAISKINRTAFKL